MAKEEARSVHTVRIVSGVVVGEFDAVVSARIMSMKTVISGTTAQHSILLTYTVNLNTVLLCCVVVLIASGSNHPRTTPYSTTQQFSTLYCYQIYYHIMQLIFNTAINSVRYLGVGVPIVLCVSEAF